MTASQAIVSKSRESGSQRHRLPTGLLCESCKRCIQKVDRPTRPARIIPIPPPHSAYLPYPRPLPPLVLPCPHYTTPAPVLHDFGSRPTPLFGWESVQPLAHGYGQPKYWRYVKPDYRRFCFSVGKASVPYAALPGGPLYGYRTTMSPQLVGRW